MKLVEILEGLDYEVIKGNVDVEIKNLQNDNRQIEKGDLFLCVEGFAVDGHSFIKDAYQSGAEAIICSKDIKALPDCTIIKVKDSRKALAVCSSNFYGKPSDKLKLIGITGTNGKTTSTFMIKSILEEAGYKVGVIGTIANYIGNKKLPAHRTTPESIELHKLFNDMVAEKVDYCVMEVSSHSLSLDRVYGLSFNQGIFTNLTQDHLDFHKTFENYYEAKLILFKNSNNTIINIDDAYGKKIYEDISCNKTTYSTVINSDVMAHNIKMHARGIDFNIKTTTSTIGINMSMPGMYNVYNALGCAAACLNEGISLGIIKKGLENVSVPGRCEIVTKNYNLGYEIIVDYAHTPDGLSNILKTAREFTDGKLISVFGCGGDRDKTKRPIMGMIGTELCDVAIITSDNPRTEEPMSIIADVVKGVEKDNYVVVENRREAIKRAMELAGTGDVIVVAGKGHEDYQILKDKTIHFDEREVIAEIIKELY